MVVAYIVFWKAALCYILTPQVWMNHLLCILAEFGCHSILPIPICAVTLRCSFSYHFLMVTDNDKPYFTCSFAIHTSYSVKCPFIHHVQWHVHCSCSCPLSVFWIIFKWWVLWVLIDPKYCFFFFPLGVMVCKYFSFAK